MRSPYARQNLRRLIGRTIVDDDDLERRQGLGERAVDGVAHLARAIPGRDDDGDRLHGARFYTTSPPG